MERKREYSVYDDIGSEPIAPTVEAFKNFINANNFEKDFGFYPINLADWYVRPFDVEGGDEGRQKLKQELININFFSKCTVVCSSNGIEEAKENEEISYRFPPKPPISKELMDKIFPR